MKTITPSASLAAKRRTKRQHKGVWAVIIIVLLLAGGGAVWYFLLGAPGNPLQKQAANNTPAYYTTTVRRGDIQIAASGSGTLVANQSVDLSFSTKGTVTQLNVKLGDQVKQGQVLATLGDTTSLNAAIAKDQLTLLQDQQALTQMQQNSSLSLAQAYQAWVKAQQDYSTAQTNQARTAYARCSKQVVAQDAQIVANDQQKLDNLTKWNNGSAEWIAAKGAYDQALANYNYCAGYTADEKTSAQSAMQVAQTTMQQDEQTYNTLKANSGIDPVALAVAEAKVKQDQTQLTQDQQNLAGINLVAPMDGTVTYLAASQGATVDTSKFITLSDLSRPTLQISVDETDVAKLDLNTPVSVVFDAQPNQTFTGKVTQVEPQMVQSGQANVAQGLAVLDANASQALKNLPLGLSATVTVIDQQANNTLLVPLQALVSLGSNQYGVFVQGKDGQLQLQPVKVGIQDSTHAQILSGLSDGQVISTGAAQVR